MARVLGRPLFSESGRARHCSDATATVRVGKAVGDFTARRRSAKVRLGKTSVAKRLAFKKRRMRPVIPCPETCITTVKETPLFCVYRPLVSWCLSLPHA